MLSLRHLFIGILLFAVTSAGGQNADINILRDIHNPAQHSMDQPMRVVAGSVMPMAITIPVGIFVYNYATTKSFTERNEPYIMAASLSSAAIITFGLKYTVNRPRPFVTYSDITQKDQHVGPYSFPSGHTATAFALATSVSLCYPKWYYIAPAYAWAITVGFSRMWLGVHYPSDVLIGALIGTACSVGSYYLVRHLTN